MDCRVWKELFCLVLFGWPIVCVCSAGKKKRANYSNACSPCATTSAFSPKNTIRARNASLGISPRLSRILRSSPPGGLQCVQIPFEESCEVGMVLRSCERDSTLGRFDRFGKPPCLGVGGGENAKEHRVRRVGGLGE